MTAMNRRDVLRTLGTAAVGAATSSAWVESLSALARQQAHTHAAQAAVVASDWTPRVLNPRQNDTVIALTELIIPETSTPGAKAARVNRFVDWVLGDARQADREKFMRGLAWMDTRSRTLFGKDFVDSSAEQQTSLLTKLSTPGNPENEDAKGVEFFDAIKAMTINGYYTTEIGLRQELGDSGQLFSMQFQGCDHPEHQA
jgi:hypothetical protein